MRGDLMSAGSMARARSAEHRVPHARHLENGHRRIIVVRYERDAVPLLPVLRRPPRAAPAENRRPRAHGRAPPAASCSTSIPKVAVGTIIRTGDGRLVLVRRAIEPGYGLWVFPGGYVDRGEQIIEAAVREAREESGLEVRIDGLVNIYSYAGTHADHHRLHRDRARRGAVHRRRVPRSAAVRGGRDPVGRSSRSAAPRMRCTDYFNEPSWRELETENQRLRPKLRQLRASRPVTGLVYFRRHPCYTFRLPCDCSSAACARYLIETRHEETCTAGHLCGCRRIDFGLLRLRTRQ